ncbi:MAG: tRNA (N(6)-L-threonylcarbamoyladenosine(37)-C(2))-methylthiotransferase MtaB [Mollicutes bacterium]|nr:tRNA (N(6)-L-threonylcarbamoyladenosine(37)-C(2))-methylthiotransferase MtaB [Mollicutes bacterium]
MKFNIITLGCKVNTYESNFMAEKLLERGFIFCDDNKKCDIIIINTCTVTNNSDKKSLKLVRRAKRENPKAILIVCGCSVQYDKNNYQNLDIDILIGNQKKSEIAFLIEEYLKSKKKYEYINNDKNISFENMMINKFNQVRSYIKIQDGCNNFCSYCIIPFVRGNIRCKDFNLIIKEANILVNNGYKEIVLTGIHTGSYYNTGKDLVDLINELSKINDLKRIRLSSVEITELNDKFIDMLKINKVFCNHLHIPLQSGSDEMLKIMNRKYNTKDYEAKINIIRSIIPDISITTDVIVGHNFETDNLFNETYEFCKKIKFSKIHVFPFSKRKKTASSLMKGEVPLNIKKARVLKLISLSEYLEKKYYNKFVNKKMDILIEEVKNNKSIGHTSNYLKVTLNEILNVGFIYNRKIDE